MKILGILFCLGLAAVSFAISICSFLEKGFLFNNSYIYASKKERETMDKKPHYRQTAVVFLMIGIHFLTQGMELIFATGWMNRIGFVMLGIAIVYAIVSSVKEAEK